MCHAFGSQGNTVTGPQSGSWESNDSVSTAEKRQTQEGPSQGQH